MSPSEAGELERTRPRLMMLGSPAYRGGHAMTTIHIRLIYPPHLLHAPVIYEMGKEFGVVTNLRRANVEDVHGQVEMEMIGAPSALRGAVEWARAQGLQIEETVVSATA